MSHQCCICGKKINSFEEKFRYDEKRFPKAEVCFPCRKLIRLVNQKAIGEVGGIEEFSSIVEELKQVAMKGDGEKETCDDLLSRIDAINEGYATYKEKVNALIEKYFSAGETVNIGDKFIVNETSRMFATMSEGVVNVPRSFDDLVDFSVTEDGNTITGSKAGAAAVGALLGGAAGAIIGSSTKQKSEYRVSQMDITMSYKGMEAELETLHFIKYPLRKDSEEYERLAQECRQVVSILKQILDSGKKQGQRQESMRGARAIYAFSVADEIGKFKQLMDQGVITQAEFESQKAKLLSLDY